MSPRDVSHDDDVTQQVLVSAARMRRTRRFNESFRAAVDRSYTKQQTASQGEDYMHIRM